MSIRRVTLYFSLASLVFLAIGIPIKSQYVETQQTGAELISGRNVNMVSGTTLPGGDPWLQRQNEPSIAVSSRNPLHLLAGANDYRTVDVPFSEGELPGKVPTAMVGDAWLGVFTSYDGGESWKSTMLPGFPQDPTANPLKGYRTAADPVVRSGPNGLFYYSGIAFNRDTNVGVVFVTRFIDNNNKEGGETIQYIDTKIIASGTATKFLDKPWIAVDMPRTPFTNITIAGQTFPRHNVYIAYSSFSGTTATLGDIMFARSTNCGTSWGAPIKISAGKFAHQGATIAIKPVLGEVLVAWRRFSQAKSPDQIYVAQSFSRGASFQSPIKVADIPPFDQPTTDETQSLPGTAPGPAFRTNSYPTMAVDKSGHVYLAWSQRGVGAAGGARIMLSSSYVGTNWTSPQPIDPSGLSFLGHQIMPSLNFAAGKLVIVWYDQRNDVSGTEYGFNNWILDDQSYRHTMDVWAAEADTSAYPNLNWNFTQVSRYLYSVLRDESGNIIFDGDNPIIFPAQFNCVNYPLFKGGHNPFIGDYIDVASTPQFVMDNWRNWIFNTESVNSPVFHVAWTDNRDVRPPLLPPYDWTNYEPPTSEQLGEYLSLEHPSCSGSAGNRPGMRNQNIYTSRITWGIEAGSPTNDKPLDLEVGRAFVVFVKNNTGELRSFRLTIAAQPAGGQASFLQFDPLTNLDVNIAPYSTISRPVFVSSSDANASVTINIDEIDATGNIIAGGLKGTVLLNGDPSNPNGPVDEETHNPNIVNQANPNIVNWYINPNIVNPNIVNPNIVNPNIVNPNIVNPNIVNPNIVNPNIVNPNIVNPNIVNPNIVNRNVSNPNIVNPNIVNPNIVNPNIVNAALEDISITDVEWTVRNDGNVTTSYTLKALSKKAPPEGVYAQLLVYKVHLTPAVAGAELSSAEGIDACELKQEPHHELILNIVNPNIVNPNIVNPNIVNPNIVNASIENATFPVEPGEEVIVDLRVLDTGTASSGLTRARVQSSKSSLQAFDVQDFVESIGFAITSQAVDSEDAAQGIETPEAAATTLVIGTSSLPDGVVGVGYTATLEAFGGDGNYTWSLNSGELPPGLAIGGGGVISGTPTAAGTYYFIVRVDDGSGQFDTQQYSIYIDSDSTADPLTILTTSLPGGVQGFWYGATLEATGGVYPRTWSLAGGALPAGLSLDSGGVISGTPAADGTYSFTVRVTDNAGAFDDQALSITIGTSTTTYYTIAGTVYDENGYPLEGAVMRGLPNTPVTGENGAYQDEVPAGWSGTVIPFKAGYFFTPESRPYNAMSNDMFDQNYNGSLSSAEEWVARPATPQAEILRDMAVDTLGNIYLTGASAGRIYTVKFNSLGALQWQAPLLGEPGSNSHGDAICVDSYGDVYVTGKINDEDFYTVKYSGSDGDILWNAAYDGGFSADEGADITIDASRNIYVTGWVWNSSGNPDYCTIKYEHDLIEQTYATGWVKIHDGGGHDVSGKIAVDVSGNVVVAGHSFGGASLDDVYIIKYDTAGNELWPARHDVGNTNDYVSDLCLDGAGNVYVTGFTRKWPGEADSADYLTVKYTAAGVFQWAATYDGHGDDFDDVANAIAVDAGGHVYVTGRSGARTDGTNVYDDYATVKYGPGGNPVWTPGGEIDSHGAARYDGPPGTDQDVANDIVVDPLGNIYVTGGSVGNDGGLDIATLKYSSSGARRWVQRYGEMNGTDDEAKSIALDPLGGIIIAGTSGGDFVILKYGQDYSSSLEITTESLPSGAVGVHYSATLEAFGGSGLRTWTITGGELPTGLNLNSSTGLIDGAPTVAGNYSFTVEVIDGFLTASQSLSIEIGTSLGGYIVSGIVYYSTTILPDVTVSLRVGPTDPPLKTTTTNSSGQYSFTGVANGNYNVRVDAPSSEYIAWIARSIVVADANVTRDMDLPKIITLLLPANGSDVTEPSPTLTWESNPEATSYMVQMNVTSGWAQVGQWPSPTNSLTVPTTLSAGTNYTWQVDATDAASHHVGTTSTSFTFTVVTVPSNPEINIRQDTTAIADGGTYDFGSHVVGSNSDAIFTIENLGAGDLTIAPVTLGGADSGQFSIQTQPTSPVGSGGSTTFTIRFSPTSAGIKAASIAVGNNDSNENPYDITLSGTGTGSPPDQFTKVISGAVVTDVQASYSCAWGDYDKDRDLDLFVANGGGQNNSLYTNNGDGTFTKVTSGAIVTDGGDSWGGAWGDYDNDGDLDLFVANAGAYLGEGQVNFLYANNGDGTFTKVTSGAIVEDVGVSIGCAWGDYDNDGDLDLFVANCNGQNNYLYTNNGDGSFAKVTSGNIVTDGGWSYGCAWADYDNDGDLDLYVANGFSSGQANFLYRNNGNGTFTKITTGDLVTDAETSTGCAWGDYDNDGDLDLFVTNTYNANSLYRNNGNGTFTKVTSGAVVGDSGVFWGAGWGDCDNDGDLDLFVSYYGQNNIIYANNGDGTFAKVTSGIAVTDGGNSYYCAWADYDKDGDLDLLVPNMSQANFLYGNNGGLNNWIDIRCIGTASNVSAIGAKVKVLATLQGNPVWQSREISGANLSQNSLNAEFGLGNATVVNEIRVEWPSGIVQTLTNVPVNQFLTITEAEAYEFMTKWGSLGAGDGQFDHPFGIAVSTSGHVYVADTHNNRIQKFTTSGDFVNKWGSFGSDNGQFNQPYGVAVDSSGYIYVADTLNNRVQKFTPDGVFAGKWGTPGNGDGQFNAPQGISVSSSGFIYVVDTTNHRVQKFTSDGTFAAKWGTNGTGDSQFRNPWGIAIDDVGYVYVTEASGHRVQKFTSSAAFLGWWGLDNLGFTGWHGPGSGKWGVYGYGDGQLGSPGGMAVDSSGDVYVADYGNSRVQKFTPSGALMAKWGGSGGGDGQLNYPGGVAVDASGYVYVIDTNNFRVQKFRLI